MDNDSHDRKPPAPGPGRRPYPLHKVAAAIAPTDRDGVVAALEEAGFARDRIEVVTAEELVRWSAAAIVAFVALGKVLSPQFLIWLVPAVPLVAGLRGWRASTLLVGALVLTQLWFPSRYWNLARDLDLLPSLFVLARDLMLVALLVVLVTDMGREPARSP